MGLVWYAALGGGAGSACRFLLSRALQGRDPASFPAGTLAVNVLGSLVIGYLLRHAAGAGSFSDTHRALLAAGFCGGFTTFSAFSIETLMLIQAGDWRRAALNVALNVVLSIGAAAAGYALASRWAGVTAAPR